MLNYSFFFAFISVSAAFIDFRSDVGLFGILFAL